MHIAAVLAVIAVTGVVALRSAWLCDDAYITFRVVDNLVDGYGLRWNIAERVMVYTHPLWCLVLVAVRAVCGSLPEPTIWLSLVLGLTAMALIVPWDRPGRWSWLAVAALVPGSKALTEYTTSGLENPLAFVVFALLLRVVRMPGTPDGRIALIAALLVMTRPDSVLLVGPLVVTWYLREGWRLPRLTSVAGALPLILWEGFALVYYGRLLPNTGPAKLGAGAPIAELFLQGLRYAADFAVRDPSGAVALVGSTALLLHFGNPLGRSLGAGVVFFTTYVIVIGGDFMSGRFFALPLFAAVAGAVGIITGSLGWLPARRRPPLVVASSILAAVGIFGIIPQPGPVIDRHGIGDERRFWRDALSLPAIRHGDNVMRIGWVGAAMAARDRGEPDVVVRGGIGLFGYYCGPLVHVIDRFALADPLLSQLPARAGSRIGHFQRRLPEGYIESISADRNLLEDSDLAKYYDTIRAVTRGPLLNVHRLWTVLELQTGALDAPLLRYLSRAEARHREPLARPTIPPDLTISAFYTKKPER